MLSKEEFEALAERVFSFHTKRAPGIYIGVAMVDLARDVLGPVKGKLNAIAETQACLSDVIQIMTGCTVGNRYLRVMPALGRYALTLFDREDGRGVRVWADPAKIDAGKTPEMYNFFHRTRDADVEKGGSARELSCIKIIEEFRIVGRSILDSQKVFVINHGKPPMLPAVVCPSCGETYLQRCEMHKQCDFCSGENVYFKAQCW
ncbi:MAG: formylmethanofuran dehydrogenase subunit E family protein [Candidatus Riflebacteria bacterium]|nr:formylmethanofuran dehydrogenase subunit E family protein [Candidatus Riflebacteria bacterium]